MHRPSPRARAVGTSAGHSPWTRASSGMFSAVGCACSVQCHRRGVGATWGMSTRGNCAREGAVCRRDRQHSAHNSDAWGVGGREQRSGGSTTPSSLNALGQLHPLPIVRKPKECAACVCTHSTDAPRPRTVERTFLRMRRTRRAAPRGRRGGARHSMLLLFFCFPQQQQQRPRRAAAAAAAAAGSGSGSSSSSGGGGGGGGGAGANTHLSRNNSDSQTVNTNKHRT